MKNTKYPLILGIVVAILLVATVSAFVIKKSASKQVSETTVSTTHETTNPDPNENLLIVVNYNTPIPDNYKPDLTDTEFDQKIDKRAAKALDEMMADCRAAGCNPLPCSGYRSVEEQVKILEEKVKEYQNIGYSRKDAEKEARVWITEPGTSEHHTGLAMDIIDIDYQILDEKQEKTDTQQWLMKHCWDYGYILRYPNNKKDITHIGYESWHYRYVGKENAKKIRDSGLCLEEYVAKMN